VDPEGAAQALEALGIRIAVDAPFSLAVAGDYLDPRLQLINREQLNAGQAWMLVRPSGRTHWLGPLLIPRRTACLECLWYWLRVNGFENRPAVANLPTTHAVTLTMAATEAAKWLLTGRNDQLQGRIAAFDTAILTIDSHVIRPYPRCPACSGSALQPGERAAGESLISPITGLVNGVKATHSGAGCATAGGMSSRMTYRAPGGASYFVRSDVFAGHGESPEEARAVSVWEAVERYSLWFQQGDPLLTATAEELGDSAVPPNSLLLYSQSQYDRRRDWNASCAPHQRVGEPAEPSSPISWAAAKWFDGGELVYIPASFAYFGVDAPYCGADSNGCAAGRTLQDASLAAILELAERDAAAVWWYNQIRRPAVITESATPRIRAARRAMEDCGCQVRVIDITNDLNITVVAVFGQFPDGACTRISTAAGRSGEEAVWRALSALVPPVALPDAKSGAAVLRVAVSSQEKAGHLDDLPVLDWREPLEDCVSRIQANGVRLAWMDFTRGELAIPVVRFVAPGLRPWLPRFAAGRLYEVPVKLGWLSQASSETGLNPVPFIS
jgi:ribosomal protein S12 methylthiotransferase accessory factor